MGRAPCCDKGGLRKGAWTSEEDEKLVSFIRSNNGHGSWRSLPQLAGLERCGKSCRLRWINYLRPNIKRGNFTPEEERAITQLHAILGNKWSNIASHLPGRTDNEVKNHWNTHLKKRLSSLGIDPATHRPINGLHNNSCISHIVGNNDHPMQYRSFNCSHTSSSSPTASTLPRVTRLPQLDQSYLSHMAQWEMARLEAESRLASTSSSAPLWSATTLENSKARAAVSSVTPSGRSSYSSAWISSPSTYSCTYRSLREGDHELFQDFPELLDMGAAGEEIANENSALLQSFESSSCISSACVASAPQRHYNSGELRRGAASASMAATPEAEITSDLTHLLPDDHQSMSMMMSAGPIDRALIAADQPCEASHAYWDNVLSGLVGPVMSCPS
eukprot:c8394_g1_i1 orf=180-1346(-)